MTIDLDALGLLAAERRSSVRFGPNEAGRSLVRANLSSAVNQMPDAEVVLDARRLATPIDYFSTLRVSAVERGKELPRFTGSVVRASESGHEIVVKALGAASMAEQLLPAMATRGISAPELVYVLARAGGFRDDQLRIEGLDSLPRETFEIVAPVDGVALDQPVDFGGVRFLPPSIGTRIFTSLNLDTDLRDAFEAPAYALVLVTADRCLDAEGLGVAAVDLALAWLTARLRYGLTSLPDGRPLSFEREESLAIPQRHDLTALRGLSTGRQWLKHQSPVQAQRSVQLAPDGKRLDPNLPTLTLQERLGFGALARAVHEPDALAAAHALFEAIEFYSSGAKGPTTLTRRDRRQVLEAIPDTFTDKQLERVKDVLAFANTPSLRVRMKAALDEDGVPITSGEIDLLWKLRTLRNDVVHGRRSELPDPEDVEFAISVVARMFIYRAARRRQDPPADRRPPDAAT